MTKSLEEYTSQSIELLTSRQTAEVLKISPRKAVVNDQ